MDADFEEIGDQRRADRRKGDRRAPRVRLDPRFAATLVNHIAPPERTGVPGYAKAVNARCGLVLNVQA
jgi:hypothetical protein